LFNLVFTVQIIQDLFIVFIGWSGTAKFMLKLTDNKFHGMNVKPNTNFIFITSWRAINSKFICKLHHLSSVINDLEFIDGTYTANNHRVETIICLSAFTPDINKYIFNTISRMKSYTLIPYNRYLDESPMVLTITPKSQFKYDVICYKNMPIFNEPHMVWPFTTSILFE
jgi:hypothetical protein